MLWCVCYRLYLLTNYLILQVARWFFDGDHQSISPWCGVWQPWGCTWRCNGQEEYSLFTVHNIGLTSFDITCFYVCSCRWKQISVMLDPASGPFRYGLLNFFFPCYYGECFQKPPIDIVFAFLDINCLCRIVLPKIPKPYS